jgi:hypothetical protein
MSTSPSPHQPQRRSISLSRLATIFAVTFGIAFGLCAVSAMAVVGDHQKIGAGLIWTSVTIEAICLVGLVVVGIIAIVRSSLGR